MEPGTLVYVTDKIDANGVRPSRIAELLYGLEGEGLVIQPLNPLTCEADGPELEVADDECYPIVNASGKPATKSEWLAAPWEL